MRVAPRRSGARPLANERRIIDFYSPEFGIAELARRRDCVFTLTWTAANDPLAFPFRLNEGCTVTRLGWVNGTTLTTSNFDMGIYTSAFARVVSTGSTARAGASAWQFVDVADTPLAPGDYYLVGAGDTAVANRPGGIQAVAAPGLALFGAFDSATDAFPLPDPLTNMALATTFTILPWMCMEVSTFSPATTTRQRLPTPWMPENLYDNAVSLLATGGAYTNTAANQALYCPVTFPISATIYSVSFAATNGTGNYDLGIYDAGFRRLASTGSTAMTAAGVKTLAFTDIYVEAGETLYVGGAWSNTGARFLCESATSLPIVIASGSAEEASALPLPATATPVTPAAATNLPIYTFGVR